MADLAGMTDKQLEQEGYRLQREKDKVREQQMAVREEASVREIRRRVAASLEALGDPELVAKVLPGKAELKGGQV